MRPWLLAALVGFASSVSVGVLPAAPSPATQPEVKRGPFQVKFDERHPLSSYAAQAGRWRARVPGEQKDYALTDHSFDVYVPGKYTGDAGEPYGLLVFISPGNDGSVPREWRTVLDKHKLIAIGAQGAGNSVFPLTRFGLALDAVHNMSRRYAIDPERDYVTGVSGGGRCAGRLGVEYPDVFRGAMPIVGCDYFRNISAKDDPKQPDVANPMYPAPFTPPADDSLFGLAKSRTRFALVTGENDMNRAQTKANFDLGFKQDGFKYVSYFEVPGMGHAPPPAEWFEKAIESLDAPLATMPHAGASRSSETRPQFADMPGRAVPSTRPPAAADPAREHLALAKNYIAAGRADLARTELVRLIHDSPASPVVDEAKKLLTSLP